MFTNSRIPAILLAALAIGVVGCQKSPTPVPEGEHGEPGIEAQQVPGQGAEGDDEASREPVTFEGTRVAVVHTANLIGELEPCG